jgi:hypothetical protein
MQIVDGSHTLYINADLTLDVLKVQIDDGPIVMVTIEQVGVIKPSITAAHEALKESAKNKRKATLEDLKEQVATLKQQIKEIEEE